VADFNYKIIKGALSDAANISTKGAVFNISFRQGRDNIISVPCYISPNQNTLFNKTAKEFLIKENIGKSIIVIGSDFYDASDKTLLMVEKVHFIDILQSKTSINRQKVDFSGD
jgi:hypothetical protein